MSEPREALDKALLSSGNRKTTAYRVWVRTLGAARVVGKTAITEKWTLLPTVNVRDGIPNPVYDSTAVDHGFMCYSTACAIMAMADADLGALSGCEFRLERAQIETTYKIRSTGFSAPVDFMKRDFAGEFTMDSE